jgi:hypothetical protein
MAIRVQTKTSEAAQNIRTLEETLAEKNTELQVGVLPIYCATDKL